MVGVVANLELDTAMAEAGLRHLAAWQIDDLAYNIGGLLEASTKERIATGKASPEGEAWVPWSEAYDDTREGRHSLLIDSGNPGLLESVQNYSEGAVAQVGTNLVYGAIHQFGAPEDRKGQGEFGGIPARPYLGVSDEDRTDILDLVEGDLQEMLQ